MPWSRPNDPKRGFDAELIIARLSYHIDRRCQDRDIVEKICKNARIGVRTLFNYRRYQEVLAGTKDKLVGPRKLSVYLQVCQAMGDNPGIVIFAAMQSDSYAAMLRLLESDLHATVRLGFGGSAEELITVPLGPSTLRRDLDEPRHLPAS